jgi:hypothetical protein
MQPSLRYGLAGIGALALLSLVQWLREQHLHPGPLGKYLLGVTPNFAAAIAITFVLLSVWADKNRGATIASARKGFAACAAISGFGLIGWELIQRTSGRFVFDFSDILATLLGIGASALLFHAISPSADAENS